jgi:hypothetical protein
MMSKYTARLFSYPAWLAGLLCLLLVVPVSMRVDAAQPASAEYQLKTALIYKLTKFVKWPNGSELEKFSICILGEDYFGSSINALEEREVNGLPIVIRRFAQSESVDHRCRVLFVSDSKQAFVESILQNYAKLPILTISDMDDFSEKGGIIQFTAGEKRIGFQINNGRAKSAGLTIAAPLLELATTVIQ